MSKVYKLEMLYASKKVEKANSRWLGGPRDYLFGTDSTKPAKERTDIIAKLKKMMVFASYFDKNDSNVKLSSDIHRLSLLGDAILGAAVTESNKIKKEYKVQYPTNSAMFCVLDDVFKISEMSPVQKEKYQKAFAEYQQRYDCDFDVVKQQGDNVTRAWTVA